jgi:peptide/nickel transport system substrate-binding protein
VGAAAGLLGACAPAATPAPAAPPAQPAAPAAAPAGAAAPAAATTAPAKPAEPQPKSGGSLRFGQTVDFNRLEGHFFSSSTGPAAAMFDKLTKYDNSLKPQPMLAESWDVSPDLKQIKFNLRKNVTYHNGKEMVSEDIPWNVKRAQDPKVGLGQFVAMSSWFNNFETPDKYSVILKSDSPRAAMFDLFESLNIVERESTVPPRLEKTLAGTGPFIYADRQDGVSLRFDKNKNYWMNGKPYLDSIEIKIIPDQQTMVVNLETGALDVIASPPLQDAVRLGKDARFKVVRNELSAGTNIMVFNARKSPTDNKFLRQAISYTMDRKRVASAAYMGLAEAQVLPWPSFSLAYEPNKNNAYDFDLDKAKAAFAKSGLGSVEIDIIYSTNATTGQIAEILQQDSAKVPGLKLTPKRLEAANYTATSRDAAIPFVNLASASFTNLEPSTHFLMSSYWTPAQVDQRFSNPQYEALLVKAGGESDAAKRKAIYSELNDVILDEAWIVSTVQNPATFATSAKVSGLYYTQTPQLGYFTDAWIA